MAERKWEKHVITQPKPGFVPNFFGKPAEHVEANRMGFIPPAPGFLEDGIDAQTSVCAANPQWDITGPLNEPDCVVDLYDFEDMAFRWLDCTLLPSSDCP